MDRTGQFWSLMVLVLVSVVLAISLRSFKRLHQTLIELLSLLYFPATVAILESFTCTKLDHTNRRYLNSAPYVECGSPTYESRLVASVIALPCWVGGWLLFTAKQLHRAAAQSEMVEMFETLRQPARFWWWKLVMDIGKKLLIAACVAL